MAFETHAVEKKSRSEWDGPPNLRRDNAGKKIMGKLLQTSPICLTKYKSVIN